MSQESERTTRVLVIEDEEAIRIPLVDALEDEGYTVLQATDGVRGLELALTEGPDLVLLDLMLPGLDGFSVLRDLRRDRLVCPVLILSARGEEWDRIQGFEYGADDYVVKPFSTRELLLRMRALLERAAGGAPGVPGGPDGTGDANDANAIVRFGEVVVDLGGYTLERGEERYGLSRLELDLLRHFLDHEGRVFTREELLDRVWGPAADPLQRVVDTYVLKLRKKIEPDPELPRHLVTVRGVGYKFLR